MKKVIVYPVVLFITMAFGFRVTNFFEKIPRTWDEEKINSLHLPLADPAIHIKAVSEDYYYRIPERVAYRSYPFYMPGGEMMPR